MTVAHDLWNDFIKLNSVEMTVVLGDLHSAHGTAHANYTNTPTAFILHSGFIDVLQRYFT